MRRNVFYNREEDRAIIGCACGGGCECGQLELRLDPLAEAPTVLVQLWFRPSGTLSERLRQAWDVLFGRSVCTALCWDSASARDAAEWLVAAAHAELP